VVLGVTWRWPIWHIWSGHGVPAFFTPSLTHPPLSLSVPHRQMTTSITKPPRLSLFPPSLPSTYLSRLHWYNYLNSNPSQTNSQHYSRSGNLFIKFNVNNVPYSFWVQFIVYILSEIDLKTYSNNRENKLKLQGNVSQK
jgi:hypothetical protein